MDKPTIYMNLEIKLPENPKIWLCGKVKDNEIGIDNATEFYDYFDGLIWVVDGDKNKPVKILEDRKKSGEIIYRKWTNDHDIQMTEFLRTGKTKTFDWIVSIDGNERLTHEFVKNLRNNVKIYQANGIGIGMIGRPYLFQFYDDQIYTPNVHCWPHPLRGKAINLPESSLIKKEMDERSGLINPFKYFWLSGRTNQCQLLYGKYGQEIVNIHEHKRLLMRWYWQQNLNLDFTLESVESYLRAIYNDKSKTDEIFFNYMDTEIAFNDFFRLKILKQDFMKEIVPNRFYWSMNIWKETGDEKQINTGYKNTLAQYNEKFGFKDE